MNLFCLNKTKNRKKTIIIILGIVCLIYQIIPFYVTKGGSIYYLEKEINSKCYYNIDYMNQEKYNEERDECLNYINQKTNKNYKLYNYFYVFEKDNTIAVVTANTHHLFKFETYKIEKDNKINLIKSFYLFKPYKMTINQYDFVNNNIYINVLGLDLTEGNFLGTTILGKKDIVLKNKKRLEKIIEGAFETW